MEHALASPLSAWESFYVIVGSSAAAPSGLQFVVIVLAADLSAPGSVHSTRAFGTPTVVHFCAVLLNSALLSAPWRQLSNAALAIAAFGLAGLVYTMLVFRHARRQTDYVPVLEDWIFHTVLPLIAYGALLVAGILLPRDTATCLFIIGAIALLLLFVGIHNAWDAVTYIALNRRWGPAPSETGAAEQREPKP